MPGFCCSTITQSQTGTGSNGKQTLVSIRAKTGHDRETDVPWSEQRTETGLAFHNLQPSTFHRTIPTLVDFHNGIVANKDA